MAPQPKRRTSSYRKGKRRAAIKLTLPQTVKCSNPACGKMKLPHRVCPDCGFYNGKKVV